MRPLALATTLALLGWPRLLAAGPGDAAFAVVVGVNESPEPELEPLRYADNDAARTFDLFDAVGVRTWVLAELDAESKPFHARAAEAARPPGLDVLRSTLLDAGREVARARAAGARTTFYFVYSGHGTPRNGHVAFTLVGSRILDTELAGLVAAQIPADSTHYIIDACHSHLFSTLFHGPKGPGGRATVLEEGFSAVRELRAQKNVGVILSTRPASGDTTYETKYFGAGVFSHVLRSGMAGPADSDANGWITYREIGAFVERAGEKVLDPRFRPQVWARPPGGTEQLIDIRGGSGHQLTVGERLEGHLYVEAEGALRIADFNKPGGETVRLRLPPYPGRLYLASADLPQEREFHGGPSVRIDRLVESAGGRKGGSEGTRFRRAMEQLFLLPFGRAQADGWEYPELVLATTVRPVSPGSSHRLGLVYDLHAGYVDGAGLTHGLRAGYAYRFGLFRTGARLGWGRGTPQWQDAGDITLDEVSLALDLDVRFAAWSRLALDAGVEVGAAYLVKRGRPDGGDLQAVDAWVLRVLGTVGADFPIAEPLALRLELLLGTAVSEGPGGIRAELGAGVEAGLVLEF